MTGSLARTTHIAIGLLGTSRPFTVLHRTLYRRLGGRGILRHGLGADAILLTTIGARTGRSRTVPLFAFPVDTAPVGPGAATSRPGANEPDPPGRWAVVASNAGRRHAPAWHHNLEADPAVTVQLGARRWHARARTAAGEEHARLWALVAARYPGYDTYLDRADRAIPIVVLEPR